MTEPKSETCTCFKSWICTPCCERSGKERKKARAARIKSLIEDSGYSRREATALVDEGMDVL